MYGAAVTPRKTVFTGALASTNFVSDAVLYENKVDGEVRYSMNTPQNSMRPAIEMIIAPGCSNMEDVGGRRTHVEPVIVYCAKLLLNSVAVSVIHTEEGDAHTNPTGAVLLGKIVDTAGPEEVGNAGLSAIIP